MELEKKSKDDTDYVDSYTTSGEQSNQAYASNETTPKPLIAGILLIIAGLLGIITWITALTFDISMLDPSLFQTQNVTITPAQIESMINICASVGIVLSIFPILGGILAIQKKLWGGALACSIISLFIIGPLFLSSILGVIALILIATSKNHFQKKERISID